MPYQEHVGLHFFIKTCVYNCSVVGCLSWACCRGAVLTVMLPRDAILQQSESDTKPPLMNGSFYSSVSSV